jgi:hypothetical protein
MQTGDAVGARGVAGFEDGALTAFTLAPSGEWWQWPGAFSHEMGHVIAGALVGFLALPVLEGEYAAARVRRILVFGRDDAGKYRIRFVNPLALSRDAQEADREHLEVRLRVPAREVAKAVRRRARPTGVRDEPRLWAANRAWRGRLSDK